MRVKVIFDTMSKWTAIVDNEVNGERRHTNSSYKQRTSNTSKAVKDPSTGLAMKQEVQLPVATLSGSVFREQICLV